MTCKTNTPRQHKFLFYVPTEANQEVIDGGLTDALVTATTTRLVAPTAMGHQWNRTFTEDDGNNGTPWLPSEGVVYSNGKGEGPISLRPRPDDLRDILPFVLRGEWATNDIKPAYRYCKTFGFMHDAVIRVHQFYMAEVNTFQFSSSANDPQLTLEINPVSTMFASRALTPTHPFPTNLSISALQPFVHSQSVLTIDGNAHLFDGFQFRGNNNLNTDLFYNSQTLTDLPPGEQEFTLTHTSPFDTTTDAALLDLGASSVSASVVYTNGTYSVTFTFPALHSPVSTPVMGTGNTPVRHDGITWKARSTAGASPGDPVNPPVTITLDDTV